MYIIFLKPSLANKDIIHAIRFIQLFSTEVYPIKLFHKQFLLIKLFPIQ